MNAEEIVEYHIHIYFPEGDYDAMADAERVRQCVIAKFDGIMGMTREVPGGPHFVPMLQVNFPALRFAGVVPWMMLNRGDLSILVHPVTGDDLADHSDNALWLGDAVPINFDAL